MNNKKWIGVALTVLLTLVVLAGVALAGFRAGSMQRVEVARNPDGTSPRFQNFFPMHGFNDHFKDRPGPHMMQGFGERGFEFRRHARGFFPFSGLIQLGIFALILWGGYLIYRRSGWQFVKVDSPETESVAVKPEPKKKK